MLSVFRNQPQYQLVPMALLVPMARLGQYRRLNRHFPKDRLVPWVLLGRTGLSVRLHQYPHQNHHHQQVRLDQQVHLGQ